MYMFDHLIQKNMTYFEHMTGALYYSLLSLQASFAFLIHAFYPDIFTETGSNIINKLNKHFYKSFP